MAAAVARTEFSSRVSRLVEAVAERIDVSTNGRFSSMFAQSTSLSSSGIFALNPNFGVNKALESTVTRDWSQSVTDIAKFTIEEARERLAALIDGDYLIETFNELVDYLKERSLALESRIMQGKIMNFLVDTRTNQAVPAAQVHQSLSYKNVQSLEMRANLRRLIGGSDPGVAFGSWEGLSMIMDNSNSGLNYTVSGKDGYLGKTYDIASADPEKNLAIIRRARAEGVELILPQKEGAPSGVLINGMPILRKSKSILGEELHPGLSHRQLSMAFGQGMHEHFEEMARKSESMSSKFNPGIRRETSQVVSLDEFRKKYLAPKVDAPVFDDDAFGFGGMAGNISDRKNIGLRRLSDGEATLLVWDFDKQEEIPMVAQCLPEGTYKRFSETGKLEGFTQVGSRGQLQHRDVEAHDIAAEMKKQVKQQASVSREENDMESPSMRLR